MNPATRTRIYMAATGIVTVLGILGILTPDEAPLWLAVVDAALAVTVAAIALRNLDDDTWARFRAALYGLAGAGVPALATIGLVIDERWPIALGSLLTIASSVLAVSNTDDELSHSTG